MSSSSRSSQAQSEANFPTAYMRVRSSCFPTRRRKEVKVAVSNRIYYKRVSGNGTDDPQSLNDYRGADNFEIKRFKNDGATWSDIVETVKPEDSKDGKHSVTIQGLQRSTMKVTVELTTQNAEQRDIWVEEIRARFAPWKLMRHKLKELAAHVQQTSSVENLRKRMERIVLGGTADDVHKLAIPETLSDQVDEGNADKTLAEKLRDYSEEFPILDLVDKSTVRGAGAIGTGITMTKLVDKAGQTAAKEGVAEKAGQVAETAQCIADISRCIAGASSVFQLVVLSARIVSMFAEANRGVKVLPQALDRAVFLLSYILRSLTHILDPSSDADKLHEDFAFGVLEKTVDTMDLIEDQLLRGRLSRFLHSKVVREIESTMEDLELQVVTADQGFKISKLSKQIGNESRNPSKEHHRFRPPLSPFFVGRTLEINELKRILEKHGSAVISQFGGMGKTELMNAFAQRAERKKEVPGGVFWLTVDGEKHSVVESIASFVDRMTGRKIPMEDRKDSIAVVAQLKLCLAERQGRWMLCLDNADNPELAAILDAVCAIAEPSNDNGWVIVTSRRGQPKLWRRMKKEQKVILQPLTEVDSMVLLWREKNVLGAEERDDDLVKREIDEMKERNFDEFLALEELCGCEGAYSLGGLPLALVQAGTYIGRFECTFGEYLKRLKETNEKVELGRLFWEAEQLSPVRDEQRSVLATWKISVNRLSETAYEVLRSIAMLGTGSIPEGIVRVIVKRVADENEYVNPMRDVLMEELVHGSSLVYRERGMDGNRFSIHRLVRRFVLTDMERGSDLWNKSLGNALLSMNQRIEEVLAYDGYSFEHLPDLFSEQHRQYISHSLAVVNHFVVSNSSSDEVLNVGVLFDIAKYADESMLFFGKKNESVSMWRSVLAALEHTCEIDRNITNIAYAIQQLGLGLEDQGRLIEAESMYHQCWNIRRELYGHDANHSGISRISNFLGGLYEKQGKFVEAELMYMQCLQMYRELYGLDSNHSAIAEVLCNLGGLCEKQGKFIEAESMYYLCLKMERELYGAHENHPEIATTLNKLGGLYEKQGKFIEAKSMYDQCLQMNVELYGLDTNHPAIAALLCNLGGFYEKQSTFVEAESMYDRCLKMQRELYGRNTNHPNIDTTLSKLGDLYSKQGKSAMAQSMYEQCLKMKREIYGFATNHPLIAGTLADLGRLCIKQGKWAMAQSMYDQCLKMRTSLGSSYENQSKFVEAESMYGKCLNMFRELCGLDRNHPVIATVLGSLGRLCERQGKFIEAESIYIECLKTNRELFGLDTNHPAIAAILCILGGFYEKQSWFVEAESMYDQCLEIQRELYGRDTSHPDIYATLSKLGVLYTKQGKSVMAQSMYDQCLKMRRELHGPNTHHVNITATSSSFRDSNGKDGGTMGKCGSDEVLKMEISSFIEFCFEEKRGSCFSSNQGLNMHRNVCDVDETRLEVPTALDKLGGLYEKQNKLLEEDLMYDQNLKMRREFYGNNANSPEMAITFRCLGCLYEKRDELDSAQSMYEQCLDMRRESYGLDTNHRLLATALGDVGRLYFKRGKWVMAQDMFDQRLNIQRELYGVDTSHRDIAETLCNLGTLYAKQSKLVEAELMYDLCLKMTRELYGVHTSHPSIAKVLICLGGLYCQQSKFAEAESMFVQCLKMYREVYGVNENREEIALALGSLGCLYEDQSRLVEAETMYDECLKMQREVSKMW